MIDLSGHLYHINYDLYFLDIEMGEINGLELAEKLRASFKEKEIIFISFMYSNKSIIFQNVLYLIQFNTTYLILFTFKYKLHIMTFTLTINKVCRFNL